MKGKKIEDEDTLEITLPDGFTILLYIPPDSPAPVDSTTFQSLIQACLSDPRNATAARLLKEHQQRNN